MADAAPAKVSAAEKCKHAEKGMIVPRVFMRLLSLMYLVAFASLYAQLPGLYGRNGILPVDALLKRTEGRGGLVDRPLRDKMEQLPTLLWVTRSAGLTSEAGMEVLCLSGMALSLAGFLGATVLPVLFSVWALYLSLFSVGETFLSFQWDILLLESGFIALVMAPLARPSCVSLRRGTAGLFLARWLLFRLMFQSGILKLTGGDPSWWNLTAMDWHYESQCIPTPLAWFAAQAPSWFHRFETLMTFAIEGVLPWLFLAPAWRGTESARLFAAAAQVALMGLIMLTGNYTFFNVLTCVLCLSCVDEHTARRVAKRGVLGLFPRRRARATIFALTLVASAAFFVVATLRLFECSVDVDDGFDPFKAKASFDVKWLNSVAAPRSLRASLGLGSAWMVFVVAVPLVLYPALDGRRFLRPFSPAAVARVALAWAWNGAFLVLAGAVFVASVIPFASSLDRPFASSLRPEVFSAYHALAPFNAVNSYGLFRSMTGVGGRPEVVIEGSDAPVENGWKEYEFKYKPGNLSAPPPFVAPHQPRLDWQMWFAALGSYNHNPWFISLVYRLLHNEPSVLALLAHNPFPDSPPKYIRAAHYTYHYTPHKGSPSSDWWWRDGRREYLPPVSADNSNLAQYMRENGWQLTDKTHAQLVGPALSLVRTLFEAATASLPYFHSDNLAVALTGSALALVATRRILGGSW